MTSSSIVTKFTNGLLFCNGELLDGDLLVESYTGKILRGQSAFYESQLHPDQIIDLAGKIVSPGFIDVQLNGAHGFDFSVPSQRYAERVKETNRLLVKSGVTSYLPTIVSSKPEVYQSVLQHLGPSGHARTAEDGSESLGAHIEGPFLSPARNGIHNLDVLQEANSLADLEACYGAENLKSGSTVKKITAAPEVGSMMSLIPEIVDRNIVFSVGHTDATFSEAQKAIEAGATMVTHMFNAMRPFGHRDPGVFGLVGQTETPATSPKSSEASSPISSETSSLWNTAISSRENEENSNTGNRPFFGLIADGIHLHSSSIKIAYNAHPEGVILVTDAMKLAGCPDGTYDWTNGERIIKNGPLLTLEANGKIAGSAVTMIECVNNFRRFTGCSVGEALACVTSHPARMLVEQDRKGGLEADMDADLVVLDTNEDGELAIDQVWKFGEKVHG
jgi:N-acetylglucosamine-6-phosphate deacetylase